jgi:hypothetical protein
VGDISTVNWQLRNNGLNNMLVWSFDNSEFIKDVVIGGFQDHYSYIRKNSDWYRIYGNNATGDSYTARSSKINPNLFFISNGENTFKSL